MKEIGTILQVKWRRPYDARTVVTNGDGTEAERRMRVVFSEGGPFALELIEGKDAAFGFNHLGYWTSDWSTEQKRLEREGVRCHVSHNAHSGRHAVYAEGSFGMLFEGCAVNEDRPQLHDLYPAGSPFFGVPNEG
jgi:hypothetical protein